MKIAKPHDMNAPGHHHRWERPALVEFSQAHVADAGTNASRAEFTDEGEPIGLYAPVAPSS